MTKHFMVDIETLSTAVNAVVLSVGAAEFDPYTGKIEREFYRELRLDMQRGRHISGDTVQWWAKQITENNADNILTNPNSKKLDPHNTVFSLAEFFKSRIYGVTSPEEYDDIIVWACDPDFDLAILSNLYGELNLPVPWKFWNTRSVRTVRMLNKIAGIEVPVQPVTHNALEDCIRQAKEVSALLSMLHRLSQNKQNLINAYNGLVACRKSGNETHLLSNVDNVLYQIGKTFSLPVEVE